MSEITLESTTVDSVNALKVDLATKIAGEQPDSPRDWLETNAQGYIYAKGQIKTLPSTTGDGVQFNLNVRTEVISIYNPGPIRIWARADGTVAETGSPSIPIEPGLTLTIPLRSAPGETQFSLKPQSQPTAAIEVSIMACGNSLS